MSPTTPAPPVPDQVTVEVVPGGATDWIIALASVASLLVAVVAAVVAVLVYRTERARGRREHEAHLARQADTVCAWESAVRIPWDEVPATIREATGAGDAGTEVEYQYFTLPEITLANRSGLPVYDVRVHFNGLTMEHRYPLVPPGDLEFRFPRYSLVDLSVGSPSRPSEVPLSISFRDTRDTWWVRDGRGRLHRVTDRAGHDAAMGESYQDLLRLQEEPRGTE